MECTRLVLIILLTKREEEYKIEQICDNEMEGQNARLQEF
jgi:hypothetical protein